FLNGDEGNDFLTAFGNGNVLSGGSGSDVFVFEKFGTVGSDNVVTDFQHNGASSPLGESEDVLNFGSSTGRFALGVFTGVDIPDGEVPLDWLVTNGYLIVDSTANVGGEAANDTVVRVDFDGSAGTGAEPFTVVTLMDVTLGTTGLDADNWLL
ncbi:MAG: hypothetical protein ACRET7_06850, partial [Burkholderiales bacterium]